MVLKSIHDGSNDEFFVKYLLPNIAVEASAIYVFFVNRVSRIHFSETQIRIISKLSNYSFGVYLVHALVTDVLEMSGMNVVAANPLFMCLIFVVITAIISNILVAGIRCIPCIGKKIT